MKNGCEFQRVARLFVHNIGKRDVAVYSAGRMRVQLVCSIARAIDAGQHPRIERRTDTEDAVDRCVLEQERLDRAGDRGGVAAEGDRKIRVRDRNLERLG